MTKTTPTEERRCANCGRWKRIDNPHTLGLGRGWGWCGKANTKDEERCGRWIEPAEEEGAEG